VSFVSVVEVRYGGLRAGWGDLRLRHQANSLADLDVVQTDEQLIDRCAQLRAWASHAGHPLAQKIHEADRWVATTALALELELVAGDQTASLKACPVWTCSPSLRPDGTIWLREWSLRSQLGNSQATRSWSAVGGATWSRTRDLSIISAAL